MAKSAILDANGNAFTRPTPAARRELVEMREPTRGRRDIHGTYDAARSSADMDNYWSHADAHDADSANSKAVRSRLVQRSRYEVANNGYSDGLVQTHANYVNGTGPSLQLDTPNVKFNATVEAAWKKTWKKIKGRRKLWCMTHAKVQDGEAFALIKNNPRIGDPVGLDLQLIEAEQCTTPYLPVWEPGYIDGIHFDEFGNPLTYDVLPFHPGGIFTAWMQWKPITYAAKQVLHWFMLRRPGQHRAVPEFRSTLNTGATSRRWREAILGAAETAADYATILHTTLAPDQTADPVAPLTQVNFDKRMMTALPMGWEAGQMKSEHPNATYAEFSSGQINEQARPKSIPQNIATCNSSGYNFASGKLDQETYFLTCDIEREDGNDLVLDPFYEIWFKRAALVYGWDWREDDAPPHCWGWPGYPKGDIEAQAGADNTNLRNGSTTLRQVFSARGEDYDAILPQMAADFGIDIKQMQEVLLKVIFPQAFAQPAGSQPGDNANTHPSKPGGRGNAS